MSTKRVDTASSTAVKQEFGDKVKVQLALPYYLPLEEVEEEIAAFRDRLRERRTAYMLRQREEREEYDGPSQLGFSENSLVTVRGGRMYADGHNGDGHHDH